MEPYAAALEADAHQFDSLEFRLYGFKVLRCTRRDAHERTCCPFAHPGEHATRRDPRLHRYSPEMCQNMRTLRQCPSAHACTFSHSVFEACLHPARYRTMLCTEGGGCRRAVCFFAHSAAELRAPTDAFGNPLAAAPPTTSSSSSLRQEQRLTQRPKMQQQRPPPQQQQQLQQQRAPPQQVTTPAAAELWRHHSNGQAVAMLPPHLPLPLPLSPPPPSFPTSASAPSLLLPLSSPPRAPAALLAPPPLPTPLLLHHPPQPKVALPASLTPLALLALEWQAQQAAGGGGGGSTQSDAAQLGSINSAVLLLLDMRARLLLSDGDGAGDAGSGGSGSSGATLAAPDAQARAAGLDLVRTAPVQQQQPLHGTDAGAGADAAMALPTTQPHGRALSFDIARAAASSVQLLQQQQQQPAAGGSACPWNGLPPLAVAAYSPATVVPLGRPATPVPAEWHDMASAPLFSVGLDAASALVAAHADAAIADTLMQMLSLPPAPLP